MEEESSVSTESSQAPPTCTVIIFDNFGHSYDPDDDIVVEGFSSRELAIEFARRFLRDNIESMREERSPEELREHWRVFGERPCVYTPDGKMDTDFHDEIDFFFRNPASSDERDYRAVARLARVELRWAR